jgi:hypothetical protein
MLHCGSCRLLARFRSLGAALRVYSIQDTILKTSFFLFV